jgi:hypothetical protein
MTTFACITSVSQAYYDHCGQACLESFSHLWPDDIPLYVYNEDMAKPKKKKHVEYIGWDQLPEFNTFSDRHDNRNVVKFAKKAFSVIHAMENIDCDRLIWLDADTVTVRELSHSFLNLISPQDVLSTHFGVKHHWPSPADSDRHSFSCETGFFIVNKRHPMFKQFAARYKEYYLKDLGLNLRRFYDGEVYGAVVSEFESRGAKMLELNPDQFIKTPFPHSVLDPYIKHYKAGRKDGVTNEQILKDLNIRSE